MPEHIQYQDDELFNPETHHEESDVPIKPLFWAVGIFILFAIVTHLGLAALYRALASEERKRMDPPATQVARPADIDVPRNQPLLQPFPQQARAPYDATPVTDLADMRKRENDRLHSSGTDPKTGAKYIPIEEAKKLIVQRGFPAPTAPPPVSPPPAPPLPAPQSPNPQPPTTTPGATP